MQLSFFDKYRIYKKIGLELKGFKKLLGLPTKPVEYLKIDSNNYYSQTILITRIIQCYFSIESAVQKEKIRSQ